nr:hypothetical protein FVER53263_09270 [Fusarium verticillioides]
MEPTGATYVLTAAQFEQQITQHGGDIAWRRAQVDRVLASFEEAKVIMSIDGAVFVMNGRETGSAIERMYQELSRHWLMDITPDVTFYPRLADPERERQLILGNIRGACVPSERQFNKRKEGKHKELSVHLEAAAKLSAEIQDEDEVKQQRTIDFQRMRDKLRLAKQRNLELEQELQEEIQNRRNTERSKQALQNRLEQRID